MRGTKTRTGAVIFQQDNAAPHRAEDVIKWFQSNNISKLDWPGYSPDLNPIENFMGYFTRHAVR